MQFAANRVCEVGVLVATILAILALCFGALSLGYKGDAPWIVKIFMISLGGLIVVTAVVACWCRLRKKSVG
jgi:hypothetical protein